jgi:hypothetical protein
MRDIMGRYRAVYRTLEGGQFYGHLLTPPKLDNPNRMEQPRLFLQLHPGVRNVSAGKIVVIHDKNYLVCDNGDHDRQELNSRTYKLIRVDRYLSWKRQGASTDPVSGLKKGSEPQNLGSIWCALEYDRTIMDSTQIEAEKFVLFTNADLQVNDIVGPYTIAFVDHQLGVTVARTK